MPTAFDDFHAYLTASWAETDLVFENEEYELPDIPTEFVYVEFVSDGSSQDTIGDPGANEWLGGFGIYLHVMTPSGAGSQRARQIGERLALLFREQPLGAMWFRSISIGAGEPGRTFGNYFAMTVSISGDRRDITSQLNP
ncbi:hypothetical protein [Rhizobium sp. IMFF44]|uniref:hypothetical protein n=1 Tax=Rhizobium sp. IMFF44 TaxID=3342350 RepID=UPI0035B6BE03